MLHVFLEVDGLASGDHHTGMTSNIKYVMIDWNSGGDAQVAIFGGEI